MKINNIDFTKFVYVDPSLPDRGDLNYLYDGLTPETAKREVPTLEDNTIYLIRRTSSAFHAKFPMGTYTGKNLFLLGMPKKNELYYDIIPEAAKTAWGNDTESHAQLLFDRTSLTNPSATWTNTNMMYCICTNANYINIINCSLQRYDTATQTKGPGFMFTFNASGIISNIKNCVFGCKNQPLDNTYAKNNTALNSADKYKFGSYLSYNSVDSLVITGCVIDNIAYDTTPDTYFSCFSIRSASDFLEFSDNIVHHGGFYSGGNQDYYNRSGILYCDKGLRKVIINNNKFYLVYHKSGKDCDHNIINLNGNANVCELTMLHNYIGQVIFKDYAAPTTNYLKYFFTFYNIFSYEIDDFSFDFRGKIVQTPHANFLYCGDFTNSNQGIGKRIIKNINFLRDDFTVNSNSLYTLHINANLARDMENDHDPSSNNNFSYICTLENINIQGYRALQTKGCNMLSGEITGQVLAEVGSYLNIDKFINPDSATRYSMNITGYNTTVRIKEFIFDATKTGKNPQIRFNGYTDSGLTQGSTCIIDRASGLPFIDILTTQDPMYSRYSVWCCSDFGGNRFIIKNPNSKIESCSITNNKTNSTATLKATSNIRNQSNYRLTIMNEPLKGITYNHNSGVYDFEFEIATKGYNIASFIQNNDITLKVKQNDGTYYYYSLYKNGYITESDAIWTDDTVTSYKVILKDIIIPLADSGESQLVEVMLELSTAFYVSNGYIYFDVNPNVTRTGNTDKFGSSLIHDLRVENELF
jgi:hypothetical protein